MTAAGMALVCIGAIVLAAALLQFIAERIDRADDRRDRDAERRLIRREAWRQAALLNNDNWKGDTAV